MKLLLTRQITETLRQELARAGRREIGGVLVGEHIEDETFRIAGISVQRDGGSRAHFVRDPAQHKEFLEKFFADTGRDYDRFNYIGEWHSHPSFEALPSPTDCQSMYDIIEDPEAGAAFAVLLIARLHFWWGLQLSAMGFRPGILPDPITLEAQKGDRVAAAFRQVHPRVIRRVRII